MNKVELVGRLTKDPEIKLTTNQNQYCNFTLAVERRFKDANGQRQTDFINCVAWKERAIFLQKYFSKGARVGLCGSIQTRSYDDNNGNKVFVTEVLAEELEFVESQPQTQAQTVAETPTEAAETPAEEQAGNLPFEI